MRRLCSELLFISPFSMTERAWRTLTAPVKAIATSLLLLRQCRPRHGGTRVSGQGDHVQQLPFEQKECRSHSEQLLRLHQYCHQRKRSYIRQGRFGIDFRCGYAHDSLSRDKCLPCGDMTLSDSPVELPVAFSFSRELQTRQLISMGLTPRTTLF
jgi:hypothetical protein